MATLVDTRNLELRSTRSIPKAVDVSTLNQSAIAHGHHQVHDGLNFFTSLEGYLDTNEVSGLVFYMPDSVAELAHCLFEVQAAGTAIVELYEGATVTLGGETPITFNKTVFNSRRPSANTNSMRVGAIDTGNYTSVAGGTLLYTGNTPASGGIVSGIGTRLSDRANELILKQNTNTEGGGASQTCYYLKCTGKSADLIAVVPCLNWYEHADKF